MSLSHVSLKLNPFLTEVAEEISENNKEQWDLKTLKFQSAPYTGPQTFKPYNDHTKYDILHSILLPTWLGSW